MVVKFSALEMHLISSGHVFGAFVFHLIGMNQIQSAMRRLNVILQTSRVIFLCFCYTCLNDTVCTNLINIFGSGCRLKKDDAPQIVFVIPRTGKSKRSP
jgi:hypothetical protein